MLKDWKTGRCKPVGQPLWELVWLWELVEPGGEGGLALGRWELGFGGSQIVCVAVRGVLNRFRVCRYRTQHAALFSPKDGTDGTIAFVSVDSPVILAFSPWGLLLMIFVLGAGGAGWCGVNSCCWG